jgi:hypothetical protein
MRAVLLFGSLNLLYTIKDGTLRPTCRTSNDYGETLNPHKNPGGFRGLGTTLKAHPTRPDWVLAHAKRPGCKLLDEVEMRCAADLLVSQVGG